MPVVALAYASAAADRAEELGQEAFSPRYRSAWQVGEYDGFPGAWVRRVVAKPWPRAAAPPSEAWALTGSAPPGAAGPSCPRRRPSPGGERPRRCSTVVWVPTEVVYLDGGGNEIDGRRSRREQRHADGGAVGAGGGVARKSANPENGTHCTSSTSPSAKVNGPACSTSKMTATAATSPSS